MMRLFLALICAVSLAPAWNLSDWQPVTQQCSRIDADVLRMHCTSAGLASVRRYDLTGGLDVSVEVQASALGRYWAGLALNADVAADNRYAEAAITRGITPFDDLAAPSGVMLADSASTCCVDLGPVDAGWHTLRVQYRNGRAVVSVDGTAARTRIDLGADAQIELLCVAVNPGESGGDTADCQFRNLRIG